MLLFVCMEEVLEILTFALQEGIEFMATVSTERAMMMAVTIFKNRETIAPGCRLDDRVLMIEDVEYLSLIHI